ncbi:MAG: aldolase [Candidatus Omnitrophica bacterium]|nr:aldolase [Candidatus Omnitrophota bacterium]
MQKQNIRVRMKEGEKVFGIHTANHLSAHTATRLAKTGLDFVFIDTEHTPLDRESVSEMCCFYSAHGVSPAVRTPYVNRHWISMTMDAGAEGIVVPYVETVEEVKEIIQSVKLRPLKGQRAREHTTGEKPLRDAALEYLQKWNQNNYVLIGVESVAAVENLDSLIAVEGLDGIFIGPHDLSISMEMPEQYNHPEYLQTVEAVISRASGAGLIVGMHVQPKQDPMTRLHKWMKLGLNWIVYSSDAAILVDSVQTQITRMKSLQPD